MISSSLGLPHVQKLSFSSHSQTTLFVAISHTLSAWTTTLIYCSICLLALTITVALSTSFLLTHFRILISVTFCFSFEEFSHW